MNLLALLADPTLSFYIAMFPLAIWMVVARPSAWPIVFLCLSAFRLPDALPIIRPLGVTLYSGFFALFTLFWHGVLARTLKVSWRPELIAVLAIFAAALLSAVAPLSRDVAVDALTGTYWKIIATALALAYLLRTVEDFRTLVGCIIGCGLLLSMVAFYNKFNGINLVEGTRIGIGAEFNSPISDPNDLALVLLSPFSFALALMLQRQSVLATVAAAIFSAVILYAIILTKSRGAILGLLSVLGVIGLSYVRSRLVIAVVSIGAGLALFAVMGIAARGSGGFADIAAGGGIDQSSYLRIIAWEAAIRMVTARPLTGVGIANFSSAFYMYTSVWPGVAMTPHSIWFGVMAEAGIPGIVAFVTMVVLGVRASSRASIRIRASDSPIFMSACALGLKASLVGFIVGGSFLGQQFYWTIYTLVALASALGAYSMGLVPRGAAERLPHPFETRPPDRKLAVVGAFSHRAAAS